MIFRFHFVQTNPRRVPDSGPDFVHVPQRFRLVCEGDRPQMPPGNDHDRGNRGEFTGNRVCGAQPTLTLKIPH